MQENNNAVIKEKFLCSYKSFINFIALTRKKQNMYNILVLRRNSEHQMVTVSVVIRNYNNDERILNEFSNNVILNVREANELIYDIREDFVNNNNILYSSVNSKNFIQTMQNANFSLNIKLNSEREFEEALEFNSKINSNTDKNRVLSRN